MNLKGESPGNGCGPLGLHSPTKLTTTKATKKKKKITKENLFEVRAINLWPRGYKNSTVAGKTGKKQAGCE